MSVQLIQGDCREVLADLSYDVFVTDPPWGVDGGRGGQVRERAKAQYGSDLWQDNEEYIGDVIVPVIRYLVNSCERGAVTPGIPCMWLYPKPDDMGCFWAPAAIGRGSWGFSVFNPIFYYGKDPRAGKGSWPAGIQVTTTDNVEGFPCAKPLRSMKWLVAKVSKPDEIVVDPFMGSGTTGVACVQLKRGFVGAEIDAGPFQIAQNRIAEAQMQPVLL